MMERPGTPKQINIEPNERSNLELESAARELYLRCQAMTERRSTPIEIDDNGNKLYTIRMIGAQGPNPTIELKLGEAHNATFRINSFGKIRKVEQPNSGSNDSIHSVVLRAEEMHDILRELNEIQLGEIMEEGEALVNHELPPTISVSEPTDEKEERKN